MARPRINSSGERELEKMDEQFQKFDAQVKSLTVDELNKSPLLETEPQTKLSTREANKMDAPYIKPVKSISRNKAFWDEKNRTQRDNDWQYVKCIVENKEIVGEAVEAWTAKWGCDPAHYWKVPVNTPVYIPRHLAEQLSGCSYHRLRMEDKPTGSEGGMQYYGAMAADHIIQRIDARPVGFGFTAMGS